MMDSPETASNKADKPEFKASARMTVHKDHVKHMKMGEPVEMKVKGHIKSMNQNYDSKDHYDVELENPEVDGVKAHSKKKDDSYATMDRGDLKKKITKDDDSDDSY